VPLQNQLPFPAAPSALALTGPRIGFGNFINSFESLIALRMSGLMFGGDLVPLPHQGLPGLSSAGVLAFAASIPSLDETRGQSAIDTALSSGQRDFVGAFTYNGLHGYAALQGHYGEYHLSGLAPFRTRMITGVVGLDKAVDNQTLFGIALGLGKNVADADKQSDETSNRMISLGAYGSHIFNKRWFVNTLVSTQFADIDTTRQVGGSLAEGSTQAWGLTLSTMVGANFHRNLWTFRPSVVLQYSHRHYDDFAETGPLAQTYNDDIENRFAITPQFELGYDVYQSWGSFMPVFGLGMTIDATNEGYVNGLNAINQPVSFLLPEPDPLTFFAQAGLSLRDFENQYTLRMDYKGSYNADYTSHATTARLRMVIKP
jgi:hypothetical protein